MHYTGTIWRPPYEAYSLLIQVTAGCTHHSCKFCTLYEDLPFKFRMSPLEEVKSDLKEANHYYKDADRVFFTGANPFVLSVDKLKILAKMVHEYFPNCQSIGCFARITDVSQKSVKDLQELKDLGYDGITFGIETGDDEALVFMKKGYLSKDIIEQCKKLEEVDMSYNFFYLTGISGSGRGEIGAKATAEIFNQLHPQIIDASMLTIYPTSQLFQEIQAGNWKEETEIEKLQELKTLIQNLTVNARFATDGASNLIQVRGNLKQISKRWFIFWNNKSIIKMNLICGNTVKTCLIYEKDVRIIVQNIQRYDDYTDKIVTNAIGNYSRSGSSHSVLYRELCAGGHVVENRLIINPEKANLYRTGSIFTEMSFLNGELTESDYITADGDINIKVRTLLYQLKIYDDRIRVELNYDLFLNDKFTSNNALIISIRDIA